MKLIPINDYGFLITRELAPYLMLAADRAGKLGPPAKIQAALSDGSFETLAASGAFDKDSLKNPENLDCLACLEYMEYLDYGSPMMAKENLELAFKDCRIAAISEFDGTVRTVPTPDDCPSKPAEPLIDIEWDAGDEPLVYLPVKNRPGLYSCYQFPANIIKEIRDELTRMNVGLPERFMNSNLPILQHIVHICGTTRV